MKHLMMLAAAAVMATPPVHADDYKLTVEQVLGVNAALQSLTTRPDGTPVPAGTYKFGGRTMMQLASARQKTDGVKRAYDDMIRAALRDQFGDEDPDKVKNDSKRSDEYREKNERFQAAVKKAIAAPADVSLAMIRQADLCLDAKPPECPIANPFSVDALMLLMPVVDPTP